jgi:spermidine/putrescine-binding protein
VHSTTLAANVSERLGRPIEAAVPREGTISWIDGGMVIAGSRQPEAALAFLEIAFSPQGVLAQWEQSDGYWSVSRSAMAAIGSDPRFGAKAAGSRAALPLLVGSAQYRPPADEIAYARAWQDALAHARSVPSSVVESAAWLATRRAEEEEAA